MRARRDPSTWLRNFPYAYGKSYYPGTSTTRLLYPGLKGKNQGRCPFVMVPKFGKDLLGKGEKKHPDQRPLALYAHLLQLTKVKEGVVLDLGTGSGACAAACMCLGRSCWTVDSDAGWATSSMAHMHAITGDEEAKNRVVREASELLTLRPVWKALEADMGGYL